MQFLQKGVDGGAAVGGDLGAVHVDGEVGEVRGGVVQFAEVRAGGEEGLEDGEAGLPVVGVLELVCVE